MRFADLEWPEYRYQTVTLTSLFEFSSITYSFKYLSDS